MRRFLVCLALTAFGAPVVVFAQHPDLRQEMHVGKLRNNAWPQPFRGRDAAAVVGPLEIQKQNGWRSFNTIGSVFFDSDSCLTEAGEMKIHDTLFLSPSNQRVLYVHKGQTAQETAARVEAVQVAVSAAIPVGPLPQILVTDVDSTSTSGELQTLINTGMTRTTPSPRLPKFSGLNTPANQTQMNIQQ